MAPQVCDSASRRGFSEIDRYSSGKYARRAAPPRSASQGSITFYAKFLAEAFAIFSKTSESQAASPVLSPLAATRESF
jgi:hypothetical protein